VVVFGGGEGKWGGGDSALDAGWSEQLGLKKTGETAKNSGFQQAEQGENLKSGKKNGQKRLEEKLPKYEIGWNGVELTVSTRGITREYSSTEKN